MSVNALTSALKAQPYKAACVAALVAKIVQVACNSITGKSFPGAVKNEWAKVTSFNLSFSYVSNLAWVALAAVGTVATVRFVANQIRG